MACFFEVFRTLLKCSPIWAQKANACTILELSRLFWYPYHLWKWLSSGDIAVFKIFLQIFLLQRHLVTVFHKWKINFKVFLIDLVPFRYFFHAFWWPNQKKCLVDFSRDTSLWKESTENLSVCIVISKLLSDVYFFYLKYRISWKTCQPKSWEWKKGWFFLAHGRVNFQFFNCFEPKIQ